MYRRTYTERQQDEKFGDLEEQRLKPILESYFDRKLYCTDKFDQFDFHCPHQHVWLELKSMRHTSNKFYSTMIGYNKIQSASIKMRRGCRVFFIFNFVDCIKYIEVKDILLHLDQWKKNFNNKPYLYIPIKYLEDLREGESVFIPKLKF